MMNAAWSCTTRRNLNETWHRFARIIANFPPPSDSLTSVLCRPSSLISFAETPPFMSCKVASFDGTYELCKNSGPQPSKIPPAISSRRPSSNQRNSIPCAGVGAKTIINFHGESSLDVNAGGSRSARDWVRAMGRRSRGEI
jgi:hypothetical protein